MPNTPLDASTTELDLRLVSMIADIRNAVLHLLRPDQAVPPSAENVAVCLTVFEMVGACTWRLSETERLRADTKYVLAEAEKVRAETEKLKAETEKLKAQNK